MLTLTDPVAVLATPDRTDAGARLDAGVRAVLALRLAQLAEYLDELPLADLATFRVAEPGDTLASLALHPDGQSRPIASLSRPGYRPRSPNACRTTHDRTPPWPHDRQTSSETTGSNAPRQSNLQTRVPARCSGPETHPRAPCCYASRRSRPENGPRPSPPPHQTPPGAPQV